jgi:hypothetical protein
VKWVDKPLQVSYAILLGVQIDVRVDMWSAGTKQVNRRGRIQVVRKLRTSRRREKSRKDLGGEDLPD